METTQQALTAKSTRIAAGEYRVEVSDGTTWLVSKKIEAAGWFLFVPCSPDDCEFTAADGSSWGWDRDFDSKKAAVAWLLS